MMVPYKGSRTESSSTLPEEWKTGPEEIIKPTERSESNPWHRIRIVLQIGGTYFYGLTDEGGKGGLDGKLHVGDSYSL